MLEHPEFMFQFFLSPHEPEIAIVFASVFWRISEWNLILNEKNSTL